MWHINILSNVELLHLMSSLGNEMEYRNISSGFDSLFFFHPVQSGDAAQAYYCGSITAHNK